MDGSIRLSAQERKVLLAEVRRGTDPGIRLRAHLLVLLNDGFAWNTIVAVLFTSTGTINRWRQLYLDGGLPAVLESRRARRLGRAQDQKIPRPGPQPDDSLLSSEGVSTEQLYWNFCRLRATLLLQVSP